MELYQHQLLSLIFICLIGIIIQVLIINNEENFTFKGQALGCICLILKHIFLCLILCITKYLIMNKFTPLLKLCFIVGLSEFSISFIIATIASFIQCKTNTVCKTNKGDKYYFDNIIVFVSKFSEIKFILYFIALVFLGGLYNIFLMLTVSYFLPTHCFITFLVTYFFFFIDNYNISYTANKIVFGLYITALLISLIYYEVIVINCCGLEKNTWERINERSYLENKDDLILMDENDDSDEENQENENMELGTNSENQ